MRYLRLLSVSLLSTFVITGCHHKPVQVAPTRHEAQAPIVTTLPPVPPLAFPNVELPKPKPTPPVVHTEAPPPPKKKNTAKIHRRKRVHKPETTRAANQPPPAAPPTAAAVLGQLSADDATANPHQNEDTEHLIEITEKRLNKLPRVEQARHKDAIVQVKSFLSQAKQAWGMNDVVGATTLANKAKILLDEMLKK